MPKAVEESDVKPNAEWIIKCLGVAESGAKLIRAAIRTSIAQSDANFTERVSSAHNDLVMRKLIVQWTNYCEDAVLCGSYQSEYSIGPGHRRILIDLLLHQSFAYLRNKPHLIAEERAKKSPDLDLPGRAPSPANSWDSMYTDGPADPPRYSSSAPQHAVTVATREARSSDNAMLPNEPANLVAGSLKRTITPINTGRKDIYRGDQGNKASSTMSVRKGTLRRRLAAATSTGPVHRCIPKRVVVRANIPTALQVEWIRLLHGWGLISRQALISTKEVPIESIEREMIILAEGSGKNLTRLQALAIAHGIRNIDSC